MDYKLKHLAFVLGIAVLISASQQIPRDKKSFTSWFTSVANNVISGVTAVAEPLIGESTISQDVRRVGFLLFPSKENLEYNETLEYGDVRRLKKSSYNPDKPLIVITHGFLSETRNEVVDVIKKAYFEEDYDVNIIGVDWSALSTANSAVQAAYYGTAAHNVPKVGQRLADFLVFLKKHKMLKSTEDIHLIGFSLGAHVSGMAGYYYRQSTGETIPRITGLDPAGPEFINQGIDHRLDSTDAKFVDITHTDRGIFGFDGDLGHVDFYPNGGGTLQSDCPSMTRFTGVCSHSDAYKYWAQGIRRTITACRCQVNDEVVEECLRNCKDPLVYGERCPNTATGEYYFQIDVTDENQKK